jgi:hypothetical protein
MENNQDNNNTGNPQSLGRQSNPAAGDIATASTQVNNQDNKPVNNDGDTAPGTVTASDTRRTAPDTAPDTHRDTPDGDTIPRLADLDKFIPPVLTWAGIIIFICSLIGAIYLYLTAQGPLSSYYIASAISSVIVGILSYTVCRALAIIVEKLNQLPS